MIENIDKLPFPDFLLRSNYEAYLEEPGITDEGAPIFSDKCEGKCIFSEKAKKIITPDGQEIVLIGKVIIKGDLAPKLATISSGKITIENKKMQIYSCSRPRNPDGSIHHTTLEVM